MHYRIPIWNLLAEKCDLTITYSEGECKIPEGMKLNFKITYLPARRYFGRVVIQKANIRKIARQYDAVIAYGDIAWLKYSTLPWFSHNKVVYHGIGVSASYDKGFDEDHRWDRIRKFFYSKANALAFYTDYPIGKYEKMGIPRERMFVAPNTVEVHPVKEFVAKDSILFIGSLYRQKGLQSLLDSYLSLKGEIKLPLLRIVGGGLEREEIAQWISDNGLQDLIKMEGPVYEIDKKAQYFARAYACISPRQAGLAVLESMGYGVPFVTSKNAITGGEIFNIHNGVDGVLMDSDEQLSSVIMDIAANKDKYIEMGVKAQDFYRSNRTPQHMSDGLWAAVEYAMKH